MIDLKGREQGNMSSEWEGVCCVFESRKKREELSSTGSFREEEQF